MKSGWPLYCLLVILFVLHNDWWWWDDPTLIAGLPIGLVYQGILMLATSAVMYLLVTRAWPSHLEIDDEEPGR